MCVSMCAGMYVRVCVCVLVYILFLPQIIKTFLANLLSLFYNLFLLTIFLFIFCFPISPSSSSFVKRCYFSKIKHFLCCDTTEKCLSTDSEWLNCCHSLSLYLSLSHSLLVVSLLLTVRFALSDFSSQTCATYRCIC